VLAAGRLARQSIDVLMDRATVDAGERIRAALEDMPVELRRARVRHAAGRDFADLVVAVPADAGVTQAHATADDVEEVVEQALGDADVVVHVEPSEPTGGLRERATAAASSVPEVREVHNVRAMHLADGYELSLHVKLPRELSLMQAHDVVERLEAQVRAAIPAIRNVHTHIEPLAQTDWALKPATGDTATERAAIEQTVRRVTGANPLSVSFRDGEGGRIALVTIALPGDQPLPSAHRHAGVIEEAVRERCPKLADVIVHTEPDEAASPPGSAPPSAQGRPTRR
jgi:divalent metal cation (Fe/Co/Zn/Cd) transporter